MFRIDISRNPLSLRLGREAPYPWWDLPVILELWGYWIVIGPAGLFRKV